MTKRILISAYTPSNMPPALLERIFVQREKLLELIVDQMTISMSTGDKHHILLVGPRGSGKTHLVSLAAWKLRQNPALADTMRIAWLGEDDVFSGLVHFAFAIAKSLAVEYPDEFPEDFKSNVRGLPPDDAALAVLYKVLEQLEHRHILLITENLDQTFSSLGDTGQKKLRAFMQETRRIASLSTSQQLFDAVSSRNEAFFGFFDTYHLEQLTVENALQLIRNIALEQQNTELVQFLDSTQARYRIRALHHLAGGNYRMYVLLAEFLTRETLDDLVSAFEALAEELTPYFQERMRSLPDQQRQLVQCLCNATGALTVKEIAEETFIAEGNCSKQLGTLKTKGYLCSEKRGKESYYDIAEPLMRLSLEVKNLHGRPLKLVAQFLKAWFPETKLEDTLKSLTEDSRVFEYCKLALQANDSVSAFINDQLLKELDKEYRAGNISKAIQLGDELSASDQGSGLLELATKFVEANDWEQLDVVLSLICKSTTVSTIVKHGSVLIRGIFELLKNGHAESLSDYNIIFHSPYVDAHLKVLALLIRGTVYNLRNDKQAAINDFSSIIQMESISGDLKARACVEKAKINFARHEWVESISSFESAIFLKGLSVDDHTGALFELPLPMIAVRTLDHVLLAYNQAFQQGKKDSIQYGGSPVNLLSMILKRSLTEWAAYISAITPLYIQHGVADKLGQGITKSIQHLDEGDFSNSQLDLWYQAWKAAGKDCEELKIPLDCLEAAIDVLKSDSPNDRPLFRLPLEVRQLIRPLLKNKLGGE
ncbi:MAG: hypothetical protein R3B84_20920 [Zavarzinella sp.]